MIFCLYRFLEQFGRHNYVTPTSYLELISSFKTLLTSKRDEVMTQFDTIIILIMNVLGCALEEKIHSWS